MPFVRPDGGGSIVSSALLAKGLLKLGHSVTALFPAEGIGASVFRRHGIPVVLINTPIVEPLNGIKDNLYKWLRDNALTIKVALRYLGEGGFSVIHCNDDTSINSWGLAAKLMALKCVWHVRVGRRGLLDAYRIWVSSRIVCVSNYVASRFDSCVECSVIYNPVDDEFLCCSEDVADSKLKSNRSVDHVQLIHIGRDVEYKRIEWSILSLLKLVELGVDASLIILGEYTEARKDELLGTLPIAYHSRVEFLGWVEKPEKYLSSSMMLVHPAVNEHFGRIFIESAGCNVPFVAMRCGAAKELVDLGLWGYISEDDTIESFQSAIINAIADIKLKRKSGFNRNIDEILISRFNPYALAHEFEAVVKGISKKCVVAKRYK